LLPLNKPSLRRVRRVSGLLFIKEVPATRSMHTNKKFHFAIGGFEPPQQMHSIHVVNRALPVLLWTGIAYGITLNKATSYVYNNNALQTRILQLFVFNTTHHILFQILY
jgi:hypothetical protein